MAGPTPYPGVPRWIKGFGLLVAVFVLLVAIKSLTGVGGSHGPGRHISATVAADETAGDAMERMAAPEEQHRPQAAVTDDTAQPARPEQRSSVPPSPPVFNQTASDVPSSEAREAPERPAADHQPLEDGYSQSASEHIPLTGSHVLPEVVRP